MHSTLPQFGATYVSAYSSPNRVWSSINSTGVRIIAGTIIGIPASSLCINRRLYLLQAGNFAITWSDKIQILASDLGISLGLPILFMILRNLFVIFLSDSLLIPFQTMFIKAIASTYTKT
jgi:hypothetical protein